MELYLPRGYLSHSSIETWKKNKDQFRLKYYSDDNYSFSTMYTEFGKEVAEILEDKKAKKQHPVLHKIPAYSVCEQELQFELGGVPIKGYIDSFDPKKKRIIEYKTSVKRAGGKPFWNDVTVKRHDQMLLYACGVKQLFGEVHPVTKLIWMETDVKEICEEVEFGGETITDCKPALYLTGNFEVFKRKLEPWEFDWMEKEVVRVANEISEDYKRYVDNSLANDVK